MGILCMKHQYLSQHLILTKCMKGLAKTVQGWQIYCCICVKVAQRETGYLEGEAQREHRRD